MPSLPQEFAGELLALAGPLDPAAIAFDPASAFSITRPATGPAQLASGALLGSGSSGGRTQGTQTPGPSQGGQGGRGGGARSRASPRDRSAGGGGGSGTWVAALALLADYLVDESVGVIRTAQTTLRTLLATPQGQEALQHVDPALRPYLEAFAHEASSTGSQPAAPKASAAGIGEQLDSPRVWRCDTQPYGQWVCGLACAMLRKVSTLQGLSAGLASCPSHGCAFALL